MTKLKSISTLCVCWILTVAITGCSDGSDKNVRLADSYLPIIFVHGQFGSVQQFETQAMRFTSNGFPQELLFAFEYDTNKTENPLGDLDIFIDAVLEETGATQVYAVGHSRGTSVWTSYLDDPAFNGPAKVAKYVNIDGRAPEELPGGVPTIGIWGEWNTANSGYNRSPENLDAQIGPNPEDNYHFGNKSHTEVATSAEAFGLMYQFFTGQAAQVTEVTASTTGSVTIAGRAVFFPENVGYAGATVQLWEVDATGGHRIAAAPLQTFELGASGSFGPIVVDTGKHYEFALLRKANESVPEDSVHHFYPEPYTHDNYFVRLQSSQPGGSIEGFIPREEDSSGMVLMRMKEFWGDQGAESDEVFINGLNILQPNISPRAVSAGAGVNIAVFAFDADGDNVTDLERGELFPFNQLTFLTGADVFMPAAAGGSGTVEVVVVTRGGGETRVNVPNWPSTTNRVSVMLRDDNQ